MELNLIDIGLVNLLGPELTDPTSPLDPTYLHMHCLAVFLKDQIGPTSLSIV